MAEKLTPQQQTAVTNRGGKLLVSAAAGSGKTKVLVDRLLSYLTDPIAPANIDEFLIITYTKAAAAELRGKIAAKLSERIAQEPENRHLQRQMQRLYLTKISTVHAFCSDILREYAYRLEISADFRVADESECAELRAQVLEQVLDEAYSQDMPDSDFLAFVDTQGLGRTDSLVPEIIQRVYDSARCHLDPEGWLQKCLADAQAGQIDDPGKTVWGRYLMEDLFSYLDMQISAMEGCANAMDEQPLLEKPAALMRDVVYQLTFLRQSITWNQVVERKGIDYGRLVFPKKFDDPELKERVKAIRAACKDGLSQKLEAFTDTAEQVLSDLAQSAPAVRGMVGLVEKFSAAYEGIKRSHRVLDFGDLEHKALDLLLGKGRSMPTAAAREIGQHFREIMVDEYQDSNVVQDAIFSALTEEKQNLFMVGDVKQSIYQFRLADPGIFLEKYAGYQNAEQAQAGQGRKVLLSSNFRSGGGVIDAVNDVFSDCMSQEVGGLTYGEDEALHEGIPHISLPEPEIELHTIQVREDTYAEEAAFVAQRISELLDGTHMVRQGDGLRPIRPEDIVILLRSPGSVGGQFRYALEQRGIRSTTGGGVDLLSTQEIGTLRSLLQVISNPRQDIPLIAALASPVFGFTADDLAAIRAKKRHGVFYDVLLHEQSKKCRDACDMLRFLRDAARMDTLIALLEKILLFTGFQSIYGAMDGGQARIANIQSFFQLAVDFEARGGKGLQAFLEHLESNEADGLIIPGEMSSAGAVSIMSIHKSKGLEFPVVFLCGLSRRFNRESLRAQVLCHKDMGLGLSCVDVKNRVRYPTVSKRAIAVKSAAESLSEEMRVLYVAMTRARDRLVMTYASISLEKELQDLALRMDCCDRRLLTGSVSCPGEWVLLSALKRTEAGELFALAGRPKATRAAAKPWKITVSEVALEDSQPTEVEEAAPALPAEHLHTLRESLSFRYSHRAASLGPSKQTATQRKGRIKDAEVSENTKEPKGVERSWRKPSFIEAPRQGREYGSAIHAVLQFIRYEACTDCEAVAQEIQRLAQEGYITAEQAQLADSGKIAAFFATALGEKIRTGENVLREFKFSILDDAAEYGEGLAGEQILLQGVVDCALLEPDGITVVDFKTDYVTDKTIPQKLMHYRPQVEAYAAALSRIYGMPVKEKYLYFFHIGRFISVE